jgi:hypothetical protein
MALEVFSETTATADPCEGAFDDPSLGQDLEPRHVVASDDFEGPSAGLCQGGGELWPLIVGVGENALDEREHAPGAAIENQRRAIAILHVGRMDHGIQEEPQRVDKNVPLAALDLLARIVALRIDRGPPFCAPLALCASMIATLGLASRPAFSRVAT